MVWLYCVFVYPCNLSPFIVFWNSLLFPWDNLMLPTKEHVPGASAFGVWQRYAAKCQVHWVGAQEVTVTLMLLVFILDCSVSDLCWLTAFTMKNKVRRHSWACESSGDVRNRLTKEIKISFTRIKFSIYLKGQMQKVFLGQLFAVFSFQLFCNSFRQFIKDILEGESEVE